MTPYDAAFFDTIRDGTIRSAQAVVPILAYALLPALDARTVIDVGCGEGHWGAAFEDYGFTASGIDDNPEHTVIDVLKHNLAVPLPGLGRFGIVLCLEVAEHLEPERALSFVEDLCGLSDIVVFSAAIPGQGGTDHLNEQWPAFWTALFSERGYSCSGALRWAIWNDHRVENWYRQNIMVATCHPERLPVLFDTPLAPVWPVVHPVLFSARL